MYKNKLINYSGLYIWIQTQIGYIDKNEDYWRKTTIIIWGDVILLTQTLTHQH